jgi:pterin-4a-carbinolamine dehydratase
MSGDDAQKYLQEIPGWALAGDSIVKEFRFESYLKGLERESHNQLELILQDTGLLRIVTASSFSVW